MSRVINIVLFGWLALVFVFIFSPIVASAVFSFNSDRFPTIPLGEFSTHWYETIFADIEIWEAARNSIIVSLSTSVVAARAPGSVVGASVEGQAELSGGVMFSTHPPS